MLLWIHVWVECQSQRLSLISVVIYNSFSGNLRVSIMLISVGEFNTHLRFVIL
jgi:hypothetical protein